MLRNREEKCPIQYVNLTNKVTEMKHRKMANKLTGNSRMVVFYLFNQIVMNEKYFPQFVSITEKVVTLFDVEISKKKVMVITVREYSNICKSFPIKTMEEMNQILESIQCNMKSIGLDVEQIVDNYQQLSGISDKINLIVSYKIL